MQKRKYTPEDIVAKQSQIESRLRKSVDHVCSCQIVLQKSTKGGWSAIIESRRMILELTLRSGP